MNTNFVLRFKRIYILEIICSYNIIYSYNTICNISNKTMKYIYTVFMDIKNILRNGLINNLGRIQLHKIKLLKNIA